MDILVKNIMKLIDLYGYSDVDFEKKLNLPRSTVYDWRKGRSKSYKKYLPEIANFFNISVDYLLGNEQKNKPTVDDDELTEMLSDPRLKSIYEKLLKLTPENLDLADSQLDAILSHQDKSQK